MHTQIADPLTLYEKEIFVITKSFKVVSSIQSHRIHLLQTLVTYKIIINFYRDSEI